MLDQTNANIERHIKTHSVRSDDDRAAVSVLKTFLRSNGRINPSFASDDTWPNHDGTFEFVPDPGISRRPQQTFYVQIKGTRNYTEREGVIKYTLKDLAFPAFICGRVSLDPGILFVILNPAERGDERVFWKYMSPSFLNSISKMLTQKRLLSGETGNIKLAIIYCSMTRTDFLCSIII